MDVFLAIFSFECQFSNLLCAIFHPNTPHNFCCPLSAYDKWWSEQKKSPDFWESYLGLSYLNEKIKHWFPCWTLLWLPFLLLRWPLPFRQHASHPTSGALTDVVMPCKSHGKYLERKSQEQGVKVDVNQCLLCRVPLSWIVIIFGGEMALKKKKKKEEKSSHHLISGNFLL